MKNKVTTIETCINSIPNGATIGIGGNTLNRSPLALTRQLVRSNKANLKIIKTAGAMDVDMLCLADLVDSVDAGFISFETKFGLANNYRKAVQTGKVKANEHACYTVISALRAGMANIPFMPVYGLMNSDLIKANDYFQYVKDPFTNKDTLVVKAIQPDYAIIHVHKADSFGNCEILGPKFDDVLLAKSSKKVIISTEQIVPDTYFKNNPEKATISGVLVDRVIQIPNGAKPGAMPKKYGYDERDITLYQSLKTKNELLDYISKYNFKDQIKRGNRIW